jgi:structural maintenance of chromosome 3 (chondroitin sulfate proteoglycan 6)
VPNACNRVGSQLRPRLATVLTELKRFGHLNKKALTQYSQFSAQREELLKRQEELQAGADAIQRVIDNLDEKKDEAIRRTLKDVSQHFTAVFKELTRNKVATLHWRTTEDEDGEDGEGHRKSKRPTVDSLVGVGVKVTVFRFMSCA